VFIGLAHNKLKKAIQNKILQRNTLKLKIKNLEIKENLRKTKFI
jgi:hypothetical protein